MSMFPDCRNDDYYNEDFLNASDESEIKGYDWCTEEVVDNFFNNLDTYFDDDSHIMHMLNEKLPESEQTTEEYEFRFREATEARQIVTYLDLFRAKLLDWIEMERDEIITSMIDGMDEDEYKAIRNKVLKDNEKSENPKEYYDTRKYAVTGKKVSSGPDEDE